MPGQSVYEHGLAVKKYLFDLISHLRYGHSLKYDWEPLPCWIRHHWRPLRYSKSWLNVVIVSCRYWFKNGFFKNTLDF